MLFIVGVKALTNNVTYSLLIAGPKKFNFTYSELNMTTPIAGSFNTLAKRSN